MELLERDNLSEVQNEKNDKESQKLNSNDHLTKDSLNLIKKLLNQEDQMI